MALEVEAAASDTSSCDGRGDGDFDLASTLVLRLRSHLGFSVVFGLAGVGRVC